MFSAAVAAACSSCGVYWSIENPRGSRLWNFGPIHDLRQYQHVSDCTLVHCSYGASHLKPTRILSNMSELLELASICSGDHSHVQLRGTERYVAPDGSMRVRNRTAGAGAYPAQLCDKWCRLARRVAPPSATLPLGSRATRFEERLQHAAVRCASAPGSRIVVSRPQEEADIRSLAAERPGFLSRARGLGHFWDHVVFGQDTNVEAARKAAAGRKHRKDGRWPRLFCP